jgi:hypothetical protein
MGHLAEAITLINFIAHHFDESSTEDSQINLV